MAFSTEGDYDQGQWIGDEFYAAGTRKRRKLTKDDMIYGVWNEGYEQEEEEEGGRGSVYGKPMSFVSSGTQEKEKEEEKGETDGGWGGKSGLGTRPGLGSRSSLANIDGDEETERKRKEEEEREREEQLSSHQAMPTSFGRSRAPKTDELDSRREKAVFDKVVKDYSQYGIGSKLLAKMGYKGGSLSGDKNAMAEPIEVKVRPGKRGLAYNFEERTEQQIAKQQKEASEAAPKGADHKASSEFSRDWQRKGGKPSAPKVVYKTAEELLKENKENKQTQQVIYDMTGKQTKVVSASAAFQGENYDDMEIESAPLNMPELPHNLRELVQMAELEIITLDRRIKQVQNERVTTENEFKTLQNTASRDETAMSNMDRLSGIIGGCQERLQKGVMSTSDLAAVFSSIHAKYPMEFRTYQLPELAFAMAFAEMKRKIYCDWRPLEDPSRLTLEFREWQEFFEVAKSKTEFLHDNGKVDCVGGTLYYRFVRDLLIDKLRSEFVNRWNHLDPTPAISLFNEWIELLPLPLSLSLLLQIVWPKLERAIHNWEPRLESIPLHEWLLPWLQSLPPSLSPSLSPLLVLSFPVIRQKMEISLQRWQPADPSALCILKPWQHIFEAHNFHLLLMRCIVPKLSLCLEDFEINPANQQLQPLQSVLQWMDLLPLHTILNLLLTSFFPKWVAVLHHWARSGPVLAEISKWYSGWKKQFPKEIVSHPSIKAQFNHALVVMEKAAKGNTSSLPAPPSYEPVAPIVEKRIDSGRVEKAVKKKAPLGPSMSFKEVVEQFAEENGFMFIPTQRRTPSGKLLYRFGKANVVLDGQVILCQNAKGDFEPATLQELLVLAS